MQISLLLHRKSLEPYNAGIAQLGERQTEDLKVPGSIPGHGRIFDDDFAVE